MEYVTISNLEDRIIKIGWAKGKRYDEEIANGEEFPWWSFHVIIKKPKISYEDHIPESAIELELHELLYIIERSRRFKDGKEEVMSFMELDCDFTIARDRGELSINLKRADSLTIWLNRENLDDIAKYLKKLLPPRSDVTYLFER